MSKPHHQSLLLRRIFTISFKYLLQLQSDCDLMLTQSQFSLRTLQDSLSKSADLRFPLSTGGDEPRNAALKSLEREYIDQVMFAPSRTIRIMGMRQAPLKRGYCSVGLREALVSSRARETAVTTTLETPSDVSHLNLPR